MKERQAVQYAENLLNRLQIINLKTSQNFDW